MSPCSYSPQTYDREEKMKLQENGLISEGRLCTSFNKILRTSNCVWKQVSCFTKSPLAHGTVWKHLCSAGASRRGHLDDTFHPDSYPTHPRKNLLMATPTQLKMICFYLLYSAACPFSQHIGGIWTVLSSLICTAKSAYSPDYRKTWRSQPALGFDVLGINVKASYI